MSWKRCIFAIAVLVVLAAFPWGPLFAWSPVHPGYRQATFSRADVLYPASATLDPAYREIVAAAEMFHEQKCPAKIKVVVCADWSDCARFASPFLLGQRPLAVTVATGTVIFVTPNAAGWADIGGLLRHELSHAVWSQNRPLLSALRMLKEPWISEGVAGVVAAMEAAGSGRHLVSLPEAEFLSRAKEADLWPAFSSAKHEDWRFSHTAWIYFWNRQIAQNGKSAFVKSERACFSDPATCRNAFSDAYGKDLASAVREFQGEVRSGHVFSPDRAWFNAAH